MRQGQQHRRGRSRGSSGGNGSHGSHNHRKGQNPLSRSFESNGPDVKVRGTAADVASKYMALARDAQTSGDPVLAENYLQHAEHYNRMIIAYREQQMQQGGDMMNGGGHRPRPANDFSDGEDGEGEAVDPGGMGEQPTTPGIGRPQHQEGQPRHEGRHEGRQDARHDNGRSHDERRHDDRRQQHGRQEYRHDRGDNPRFRDRRFDRGDRQDRGDRPERQERAERPEYRGDQGGEPQHDERPVRSPTPVPVDQPQPVIDAAEPPARDQPQGRRRERYDMMKDQPEFLRRPVRRPRREESAADGGDAPGNSPEPQEK